MDNTNTLSATQKDAILRIILQHLDPDDYIIFLFGTFAAGKTVRSSDIDIGILSRDKVPDKTFIEIQEELDTNVPTLRKIDLVDFSTVDEKVKDEALKEIKLWHSGKNCHALLKSLKLA